MRLAASLIIGLLLATVPVANAQKNHSLALFNFVAETVEAVPLTGNIDASLRSELKKYGDIELKTRRGMEDELSSRPPRQSNSVKAIVADGIFLGVEYIIAGRVKTEGSEVSVTYELYDMAHGAVVATHSKKLASSAYISQTSGDAISRFYRELGKEREVIVDAPVLERLEAKSQAGGAKVSWQFRKAPSGASFRVLRSTARDGNYTVIGESRRNVYRDLRAGQNSYFYKVALIDANGEEWQFDEVAEYQPKARSLAVVTSSQLAAPVLDAVSAGVNSLNVAYWPSVRNPASTSYKLFRRVPGAEEWNEFATLTGIDRSGGGKQQQVTGNLEPGAKYEFQVRAVATDGAQSQPSVVKSIDVPGAVQASVVNGVQLRQVDLSWSAIAGASGYRIYRRAAESENWQKVGEVKETGFSDKNGLGDGSAYQYYVTAHDGVSEAPFVTLLDAETKAPSPPPEGIEVSTGEVKAVTISWAALNDKDISAYEIQRSESADGESFQRIALVPANEESRYVDRKLIDGRQYFYRLASVNRFDAPGPYSEVFSTNTKALPGSSPFVSSTTQGSDVFLEWQASTAPDVLNYRLYRMWEGQAWELLKTLGADVTSYTDKNVKPYRGVAYRVEVVDSDKLVSPAEETEMIPSPVTVDLQVARQGLLRKIELQWSAVNYIDGYKLYRGEGQSGDSWQEIKRLKANETSFSDAEGLSDGSDYRYKLVSFDDQGDMPESNIVAASTKPAPAVPGAAEAISGQYRTVTLQWQADSDSDVAGYHIYRSEDGKKFSSYEKVKGHTKSSFVDKGGVFSALKDASDYHYQIAAYNRFNGEGERTAVLSARTKEPPPAVEALTATAEPASIVLNWQSSSVSDIVEVTVQRSEGDCSRFSRLSSLRGTPTSFNDEKVEAGTEYCYAITVKDKDGLVSARSASATARM